MKIPFHLLLGPASEQLPVFVKQHRASAVVCDFSPLRVAKDWVQGGAKEMDVMANPLVHVIAS